VIAILVLENSVTGVIARIGRTAGQDAVWFVNFKLDIHYSVSDLYSPRLGVHSDTISDLVVDSLYDIDLATLRPILTPRPTVDDDDISLGASGVSSIATSCGLARRAKQSSQTGYGPHPRSTSNQRRIDASR
jgi:hypothetical protein